MSPNEAANKQEAVALRSPPRLLIVDDDEAIRESLGEALREEGFEVVPAADGREALAILRSTPPPCAILLDLMMPVMDGWDFRHEQLEDPFLRDIPVLVVSASGFSPETIRLQLGEVELLRKPVHQSELLKALGRACGPTGATS